MAQPRYQVIERIDAGGMAEVFKAESTSMQGFQKLVAIKRVLPSLTKNERFVRMFLDEAKVSLHLNHTNCVQVFDLGIADGTYFIVMEFIDGTNLKNILEQLARDRSILPIEQVVYIAIEICKGLSHAHNKRDLEGRPLYIVHRDISPPNVLLSREGEVKITDFGLAKAQSQVETTDPGVVKGKFGYLSPEAANGDGVDMRTDVFAVGILLWEMLVGKRLFLGKTDYETLKFVQDAKIPPLQEYRSDVPHQLSQIVERALARDLNYRYQDAKSLANALAEFLYSWGRSVTSFDVAYLVQSVMAVRSGEAQRIDDTKINEAVQREINKLKSLEEIDNLDLYLANTYTSTSSHDDIPIPHHGSLEDPASWAMDLDIDQEEAPSFLATSPGANANTWAKADISQLLAPETVQSAYEQSLEEQPTMALSRSDIQDAYREDMRQATQAQQQAPAARPAPRVDPLAAPHHAAPAAQQAVHMAQAAPLDSQDSGKKMVIIAVIALLLILALGGALVVALT